MDAPRGGHSGTSPDGRLDLTGAGLSSRSRLLDSIGIVSTSRGARWPDSDRPHALFSNFSVSILAADVARPTGTPAGSRRWNVQVAWASSTNERWQQVAPPCPLGYQ